MKKFLLICASLCVLAACNEKVIETPIETDGVGFLSLGVNSDNHIAVKADVTGEPLDAYTVKITNTASAEEKTYTYGNIKNQTIPLAVGTYKIEAYNCTEQQALDENEGKGQKHIYGVVDNLSIVARDKKTETVACSVINTAVKVNFDESFKNYFTTYSVTLKSNLTPERNFTITKDTPVSNEYYWNIPAAGLKLSYSITAQHTGEEVKTQEGEIVTNAEKAKMYCLNFIAGDNGGVTVTVTANDNMDNVDNTVTVDPYSTETPAN